MMHLRHGHRHAAGHAPATLSSASSAAGDRPRAWTTGAAAAGAPAAASTLATVTAAGGGRAQGWPVSDRLTAQNTPSTRKDWRQPMAATMACSTGAQIHAGHAGCRSCTRPPPCHAGAGTTARWATSGAELVAIAQQADQQAVGHAELPQAGREARPQVARPRHRAEQQHAHHADPVGQAPISSPPMPKPIMAAV